MYMNNQSQNIMVLYSSIILYPIQILLQVIECLIRQKK